MHPSPLRQLRVLIIEDEMLVATELAQMVSDAGYTPVGPVSTVLKALEIIADEPLDAALLDYRLVGETSVPVSEALEAKRVPFAIASAFVGDDLPVSYRGVLRSPSRSWKSRCSPFWRSSCPRGFRPCSDLSEGSDK